MSPTVLAPELVTFLASEESVLIGTRDESLFPESARCVGVRVEPGACEVTVFVPMATGEPTVANLAANGRAAISVTRPRDHRSFQLKGPALEVRAARPDERAIVERYRVALAQELGMLGLPPRLTFRVSHWPCHAVRVRVESMFVQTPGPGAGARLDAEGAARIAAAEAH